MSCKEKKLMVVCVISLISCAAYSEVTPIWPGEIIGRDLNVPIGGSLGHVGITTGDNMTHDTQLIIEVLDEEPVIQINNIFNFKSRSKYWGSRWGIGDQGAKHHQVVVEANHQRWWGAEYTFLPKFELGEGDLRTGRGSKKGTFRCDTFAAWAFYSQGYNQLISLMVMTPANVFKTFPKANNQFSGNTIISDSVNPRNLDANKQFDSLTADEVNKLPLEEFLMLIDIPEGHINPSHIAAQWKFSATESINDTYRGALIDNLSFIKDSQTVSKFINMYKREINLEVKKKLLIGLNRYAHNHIDITKESEDRTLLKSFYESLMNNSNLSPHDYSNVLYGYLYVTDDHTLAKNHIIVDNALMQVDKEDALRIYTILIHISKELEKLYVPEIIKFLKDSNNSSLDEMFFGTTKLGYESFKDVQTIYQIKEYITFAKEKYSSHSSVLANSDPYYEMAKSALDELDKEI